jgi:hypothetical protein
MPKPTVRDHDGPVYADDSVELFLEPVAGSGNYFQFVTNVVGARYEGAGMDKSWNGAWEAVATAKDGTWTVECAIPFATLGITPVAGVTLGFNLTRNDRLGNQSQSWADLSGYAFHTPSQFGRLVLGAQAIGMTGLTVPLRDEHRIAVRGQVTNGAPEALTVRWLMRGTAGGEAFRLEKDAVVPPGGSTPVALESAMGAPGGLIGWRSLLLVDDLPLYVSPPVRAPFLRLPVLGRPAEPLVLSNQRLRLVFDANTGALVSLRNLQTGREMLAGPEPRPLFRLDTVNYRKNPMFFREDEVLTLTPSLQTFRMARADTQGPTQVLTVVHQFDEGVTVTATVSLGAKEAISHWGISVANVLPRRPRDGAIIHRVTYPLLGGLKAAEADTDQAVALPDVAGRLVREPGRNLATSVQLEIPGWTSMSWAHLQVGGGLQREQGVEASIHPGQP